ncbi:hypothetical protein OIE73_00865 [Streptomyces hirsutus]|uniref:Uncharacterized protein n=1 Tax=Streptomyces hirsutus TaxID=35620 RepID=A0ABZ1GG97_9ACTN|nr:hypothetical protein [Streptomyces hirsutus]WSD04458.1 hypothetical protein OIE73_00865 [Streptomyces hirsutus]
MRRWQQFHTASKPKPGASESDTLDCTEQTLDQAEWMGLCSDETGTGGDGTEGQVTGLTFGESYTWPDGLKVTVVAARVFTDYDPELLESAEPGSTGFRVTLKLENGGKPAVDLDDLSVSVEGAANGGEAAFTMFEKGSQPLEGRLASGVAATKTNDNVLETKYGWKIVVTVQRNSENFDLDFPEFDFPEFEGEIADWRRT